ncbi:uncharacterized protein LOC117164794 [Bombus vancouverensis nearcticus]|uniref:uncharacterized protein LOC117164794 n=1 Tax=Bombus vancouverensis nearcticus TaxID=2705178 RepID=UPI001438FF69|nr:uncharacterized protein LOC117164756 [Bombus vancouverensis nearcticus]XP_033204023.1 uncharacterized protein LOC117164794 [Bombus vancouverensis nearcticus]
MTKTKERLPKPNADKQSETERLVTWINKVRRKQSKCRRNRRRDLRIEAVLRCALSKAEDDLRVRRLSTASKWEDLKKQCLKKVNYTNYELYNGEDTENPGSSQQNPQEEESSCPELSSLDDFMSKLAEIKVPLQR